MIRLSEVLAPWRILYPRPIPTLPDIMMLDIAEPFAGAALPLGRYYPILVETLAELRELQDFLDAPRPNVVVPDLLDRRPSALLASRITFANYDVPGTGWPSVLLCHWPAAYAGIVAGSRDLFARGSYTLETLASAAERADHTLKLIATLGRDQDVDISILPPLGPETGGGA